MARTRPSPAPRRSPRFVDPNAVVETPCFGPFHVLPGDPATITFTHARASVDSLFSQTAAEVENVVTARIVLSQAHLIELRDVLNRVLPVTN